MTSAVLLVVSLCLRADPLVNDGVVGKQPADPPAKAIDPGAALVDSLERGGLGALRALRSEAGIVSDPFAGKADDTPIRAARFAIDLDGIPGDEVLLRVTTPEEIEHQYLALRRVEGAWRAIGSVELRNQRGGAPVHRLEAAGGRRWVVIRSIRSSGSGFERVQESWHDTSLAGLPTVLIYPVQGHVSGHGLPFDRAFTGRAKGIAENGAHVDVELSVRYTNGILFAIEGLHELFTRTSIVRYARDEATGRFAHDDGASGLTEAEAAGIFADDAQGFLHHNFAILKALASGGESPKREWITRFLDLVDECPERAILRTLLTPAETGGSGADAPNTIDAK